MSPDNTPSQIRASQAADRVLERIVSFYGSDKILDDGESDAMAYATSLRNYSQEWGIYREYKRWKQALEEATREKGRSYTKLREEIWRDSVRLKAMGKSDGHLTVYGTALENLANSVLDPK
jgi:hypothetical protein